MKRNLPQRLIAVLLKRLGAASISRAQSHQGAGQCMNRCGVFDASCGMEFWKKKNYSSAKEILTRKFAWRNWNKTMYSWYRRVQEIVRRLSSCGCGDGSRIEKSSSLSGPAGLDGKSSSSKDGWVQIRENVCASMMTCGSCPEGLPRIPSLKPIFRKWSRYFSRWVVVSCNFRMNSVFGGNLSSRTSTDFLEIRGWIKVLRRALFCSMIFTWVVVAASLEPFRMGWMKL